jgi:hypothetical protein
MHDDELTALLEAERPRPREGFAEELDARVAARFPPRPRAARRRSWNAFLHRPFLPAAATALAVGLIALVVALSGSNTVDSIQRDGVLRAPTTGDAASSTSGASTPAPSPERAAADEAAPQPRAQAVAPATGDSAARKVERTASIELGTDPGRVDDVAQGVLGVVGRYGGIVDRSSVQSAATGGTAQFELRIPAARLQPALAALSRLPDANVLARTDDTVDVNQAYVSVRRRLANARAERAGVVRALTNAETEDETLRLRARLDTLERTIADAERAQRALDRRVDYSRVSVAVHGGADGGTIPGSTDDRSFTFGGAAHDALRVLEVAAGVVVIAAAALLPAALLAALAWPLASVARRRRREQALG